MKFTAGLGRLALFILSASLALNLTGCGGKTSKIETSEDTTTAPAQVRYAVITGSGVNVRSGPGIGYRVRFQVDKDAKVKLLEVRESEEADTGFVVHDWVDDGQGNFTPPYKFADAVMIADYKVDEYVTLNKGMGVRVCFSGDPGGHGWVHVEYVVEGKRDTLALYDMPMVRFREKVKPAGGTAWYKIETEDGQKGWVFGDYVKEG